MLEAYLPLVLMFMLAFGLAGALTLLATWAGPKKMTPEKSLPYECGLDPIASPKIRLSVRFYRLALLFLVFDIEAAFFYPWAVLYRELSCKGTLDRASNICTGVSSPMGFLVMIVFMAILLLALVFVWRKRALEWD